MLTNVLKGILGELWCVPTIRAALGRNVSAENRSVVSLLTNIRLLTFAFVTSPILSLIPFALTNSKEWGLVSFAIGTLSIICWLKVFSRVRSTEQPSKLIRNGAVATILLSTLLGAVLIGGSLFDIPANDVVAIYLFLQLFTGIPFALITGVDSKLSGAVFRSITSVADEKVCPNAEFRRCKAAGSTAASAAGALAWCAVILFHHEAIKQPGWYSVLFALNVLPAMLLLRYLRRLERWLREHPLQAPTDREDDAPDAERETPKSEITESVIAIGCLEGLMQFSQFYFAVTAIKLLFEKVPDSVLYLIAIPLMFYIVNGIEQVGALLFARYHAKAPVAGATTHRKSIKRRQYASLLTLFVAAILFALHVVVGISFNWSKYLDVVAYALFNIIKGFAGGLSEEWNESILRHFPQHDEARFTTSSALFGRLYQIAAIGFFIFLNLFVGSDNWVATLMMQQSWLDALARLQNGSEQMRAFVGTLTIFIFILLGANILAYFWIGPDKSRRESTWKIIARAVIEREERTALFTQLLRVLFVVSLILSNLLSLKVVSYRGLTFVHGSIFYIMLFVLINLIAVFEDIEAAIKTVFLGMVSYVVVFVSLLLSASAGGRLLDNALPATLDYNILLGQIANLYSASFCAYTVTVVLNVGLLTLLAKYFESQSPVVIGAVVTFICQAVDTLIFIWLGYGGKSGVELTSMMIGQFSVKLSVYLIMYFPLYYLIMGCKQWLGLKR
ncbi:MAG: VUT family protein [Pyrinomonadaceae bacterium]